MRIPISSIVLAVTFGSATLVSSVVDAQELDDPLSHSFGFSLGAGYLHTGGDITEIWGNGYAMELSFGYRPWRTLGVNLTATYARTSITDWAKNRVHTYTPSTGYYGTSESGGGDFYELLVGPAYSAQLFNSDVVLTLGGGGVRYGAEEAGMSEIEDYFPRWTFGWGYYLEGGLTRHVASSWGAISYGLTVRYSAMWAKINDFVYDRVYGAESYDAIPPVRVWDRRVEVVLTIGMDL